MAKVLFNPDGSVKSLTGTPTSRASKAAAASLAASAPAPVLPTAPITAPPAPGQIAPIAAPGPGQLAPVVPATGPGQLAPVIVDPKQLAATANQEAQGIYEQTKDQDIDIRDSQKIIRDLATKITGDAATPPPKPPSMMEMFTQQRQQLGLEPLENDLARIDSEIERLNVEAFTDADRTSEAPLGMRAIGNKQGAISREAQRSVALLQVERSAVARQVANKTSTLQMVMDFTQQDFANASQSYEQNFSRNMQTLDLLMKLDDRELTAQDRLQQNATANLQTIWNSMKESGASFETLNDTQRNSINQMEMQAGLPAGFFESLPSIVPAGEILSTTTREDGGTKFADIISRDASGAYSVHSVALGSTGSGSSGSAGGSGGSSYAAAAGYNGDFAATISNVANLEATVTGKKAVEANLKSYIAAGDYKSAYNQIANSVEAGLVGESKQRFANARTDSEVMQGMKNAIQQYSDAGGDMNLLKGTAEGIYTKLGTVKDPKFKSIAVALQREFQTYRNTMTGAAFSPAESAEYQSVNPTANNTLNLNLSVIEGAISQLNNRVTSTVKTRAGEGAVYIKEYAEGAQSQAPASSATAAAPDNEYLKWLQANGLAH